MRFQKLITIPVLLLLTQSAFAVKIADITRMDGARTNVITGMGLVMGLKGTGDGGAYLPAMRPLQQMLKQYDDASSLGDLNSGSAANVAIVTVYATLPATGVHNGDTVDVNVVSMGAATSLKNGVLFMAAMNGPTGKPFTTFDKQGHEVKLPFALAKGELERDDSPAPLKGVIRGGAVMEVDLPPRYIDETGRFKLNINQPSASWAMSNTIAKLVNEASDTDNVAVSLDPGTVLVQIPESERKRPDGFIARILALPIPATAATEATEARVLIDDSSGTMIITGDVEISPVVISHKGLTITAITPPPVASARNPLVQKKDSIPFDTMNQGGARLKDLADAFDQLKVPTEDRIAIVKNLYEIGKLHAKMTINGQER
jgi:flagellar P-ring protein precursor FlgI